MSTTVNTVTEIRPFHVEIPQEQLDDLRRRIAAARWPSKELVEDRSQGVQLATLREVALFQTRSITVRCEEAPLLLHLDGELLASRVHECTVTVEPKRLRVLVAQ